MPEATTIVVEDVVNGSYFEATPDGLTYVRPIKIRGMKPGMTYGGEPPVGMADENGDPILVDGSGAIAESGSPVPATTPLKRSIDFGSYINSKPWQGQPAHTWVCHPIESRPFGGFEMWKSPAAPPPTYKPFYWHFRYVFEFVGFKSFGVTNAWDRMLLYRPRGFNRPPSDIDPAAGGFPGTTEAPKLTGNGWTYKQIQGEKDFNLLGLPNLYY